MTRTTCFAAILAFAVGYVAPSEVRAQGLKLGWCNGVGNPHHSANCGGGSASTPGTTHTGVPPSVTELPHTNPLQPTGPSVTVTQIPQPYPIPVPMPYLAPKKAVAVPQLVPKQVPYPIPTPTPYLVPKPVPPKQPIAVPPKVPPMVPYRVPAPQPYQIPKPIQIKPVLVPPKIAVPTPVPYPVPNLAPNQVPKAVPAKTPIAIPRPIPTDTSTSTIPSGTVSTSQTAPNGSISHSPDHVTPPRAPQHIARSTGRHDAHQLPRFVDTATRATWDCYASGHGRRRHRLADGGETATGALPLNDNLDAFARDVPARHSRDPHCLVSIKRRHRNH